MHGAHGGRPITHGRYSKRLRQSLAEDVAEFLADPQPLNLLAEVAFMRALVREYASRFKDDIPLRGMDIDYLMSWLAQIGKQVERIERAAGQKALTVAQIQYLQARLVDLIMRYIDDPDKRFQFVAELRTALGFPGGGGDPVAGALPSSAGAAAAPGLDDAA